MNLMIPEQLEILRNITVIIFVSINISHIINVILINVISYHKCNTKINDVNTNISRFLIFQNCNVKSNLFCYNRVIIIYTLLLCLDLLCTADLYIVKYATAKNCWKAHIMQNKYYFIAGYSASSTE